LIEARESLGLSVDQSELWRKLAQNGDRGRLIIDKDATFAVGKNLAAENDLGAFGVDPVVFKNGFGGGCGLENAGHDGFIGAMTHNFCRRLTTHQQRQSIYKNRLPSAGFAGEQVESRAKCGDGVIDNRVVLGAQLDEHSLRPFVKAGR
jgi:hypothetical protein